MKTKRPGVKERILEAASELFYFKGYNQTGINQIIEEAQVAKASMYQHFRSKEDIAVAYLQRRHVNWMGDLMAYISDHKTSKAKLLATFDYLEHWLVQVDFRGCGFQNIVCDLQEEQQKIKDQVLLHKNEVKDVIYDLLKADNTYENPEDLGNEVMVLLEGSIILSQIQKNKWPIVSGKSAAERLLN